MSNHGDGIKHDSTVVKMDGNENLVVTFTVGSLFCLWYKGGGFYYRNILIFLSKWENLVDFLRTPRGLSFPVIGWYKPLNEQITFQEISFQS